MLDCEIQPKVRSIAPADDSRSVNLQEIHHAKDVTGHQVVRQGLIVTKAASMAAVVHHDHLIVLRQCRHLVAPVVGIRKPAMKQEHGVPASKHGVPDLGSVYS